MAVGSSFTRFILVRVAATAAAAGSLSIAPATAGTAILPISISSMCATASIFAAGPESTEPAAPGISKAQAILGGAPSKLDLIKAQHIGVVDPTPAIAAGSGFRTLCGAPSPMLIASVRTIPPAAFAPPPQFAQSAPLVEPPQFVAPPIGDRPDIFGSVALKVSATPLGTRWAAARSMSLGTRRGPWAPVIRENRSQQRAEQVAAINSWVNARIRFVDDRARYGRADHWASAAQSLSSRQGDCEDYAIAKMQMLKALGMPDEDLYFVIARDLVRQADHALLVVRLDGKLVALDNETDRLLDAAQANDYRPVFTYAGTQAWTHGYRAQPVTRPLQTASLTMAGFGPD